VVFRYADEIFSIGRELTDVLRGRPRGRPARLHVGVSDVVPKLIAHRILAPVLDMPEPVHLLCIEDDPAGLAAALSSHGLDLVISDAPLAGEARVKAYSHLLGSCPLAVFGAAALAARHRRGFPRSLDGAPLLLPTEASVTRRPLEQWLESIDVRPRVVGEFQDSALLKTFGAAGSGLFCAPSAIEREVCAHYRVKVVGRIEAVIERFYAISVERRLKHPAVVALTEAARTKLFTGPATVGR
jgi:LysR family transcriptional activator of nhaA